MIALGCDHGGFELKNAITEHLKANGTEVCDCGCYSEDSVDYPVIAKEVCDKILSKECELGILCCGTGIGMSIAANKIDGIRAAACSETFSAELTRRHNNSNVLCLGGRVIGVGTALKMVDLFLNTPFEGGRHQKRIDMVTDLEK